MIVPRVWNGVLWSMRIGAPLLMVAALVVGFFAWRNESYTMFGIDKMLK